jgi:glycosyltransferase involved in cell wall biosynthesis
MRIGISTRGLNQGSFAISSIIYHLTNAIVELASKDIEIFLYFNNPDYEILFSSTTQKRSIKLNNRFFWDHAWLPLALKKDKIDIALFMKGTMPLVLPCKGAVVFHDLGYFNDKLHPYKFLDTIYMKRMMPLAARKAYRIFTDSEYTRNEAIALLEINPQKISVCHPTCSSIYQRVEDVQILSTIKVRYGLPSKFIFSPASLSPRKNYGRILDAYRNIQNQIPHHLIISGGQSWQSSDLVKRINSEFSDRVHILGNILQEDMPALYTMATFTLYPSLLEGFGLPILESFRCGCPILTSNLSALPEIAGDAAYLVNPYDDVQISEGMLRLSEDQSLRKELVKRGYERAKLFSWEKSALTILENLLK